MAARVLVAAPVVFGFGRPGRSRLLHRLADPVRAAGSGDGEPDIVEGSEHLGGDVMCAVFVADDAEHGDLA